MAFSTLFYFIHSVWQYLGPPCHSKWHYFVFFQWLSSITLYIGSISSLSFLSPWIFRLLPWPGYLNSASMNIVVHAFFQNAAFLRNLPRSKITGTPIFRSSKNLHNVFHHDCTNLQSHQQSKSVLFSLHCLQHLLFVEF